MVKLLKEWETFCVGQNTLVGQNLSPLGFYYFMFMKEVMCNAICGQWESADI